MVVPYPELPWPGGLGSGCISLLVAAHSGYYLHLRQADNALSPAVGITRLAFQDLPANSGFRSEPRKPWHWRDSREAWPTHHSSSTTVTTPPAALWYLMLSTWNSGTSLETRQS